MHNSRWYILKPDIPGNYQSRSHIIKVDEGSYSALQRLSLRFPIAICDLRRMGN